MPNWTLRVDIFLAAGIFFLASLGHAADGRVYDFSFQKSKAPAVKSRPKLKPRSERVSAPAPQPMAPVYSEPPVSAPAALPAAPAPVAVSLPPKPVTSNVSTHIEAPAPAVLSRPAWEVSAGAAQTIDRAANSLAPVLGLKCRPETLGLQTEVWFPKDQNGKAHMDASLGVVLESDISWVRGLRAGVQAGALTTPAGSPRPARSFQTIRSYYGLSAGYEILSATMASAQLRLQDNSRYGSVGVSLAKKF